jgi:hypothetical protein
MTSTPAKHLNQIDLSRRWRVSPRTLERWRWMNEGPPYLKIGGRVLYRAADIEVFEAARLHASTTERVHAVEASTWGL